MGERGLITSLRLNNDVSVAEFVELAQLAESLGFDQIWVSDDLFFRSASVLLAAAAVATDRISLGTSILNPYSIHPAEIAMMATTLQELSGGRFLLGLAAGAEDFLAWAGLTRHAPLARTREAIIAIRALLSGACPADVEGAGDEWQREAHMRIPVQSTPIYLGAMSPRMLELVGTHADGGLPLLYPPETFVEARAHVDAGIAHAGRSRNDVDLAACIWVSVDDDVEKARRSLAEKLAYYGASFSPEVLARVGVDAAELVTLRDTGSVDDLPPAMMSLGIAGRPDDVIGRCRALVEAGTRHLSFGPPLGPDRATAVRLLGQQVIPAVAPA